MSKMQFKKPASTIIVSCSVWFASSSFWHKHMQYFIPFCTHFKLKYKHCVT